MTSKTCGPVPAVQALLPKPKVSVSQLRILMVAVERDPSLYYTAETDVISPLNVKKWLDLSNKLNDCLDGTTLNTQDWKYVLRNWADNVKNGIDVMSKERLASNKANPSITLKQAKELTRLERRFNNFLNKEDAKDFVDVTYTGKFGADQAKTDASDNVVKVKVQLMNASPRTVVNDENVSPLTVVNDENVCPDGPKKRSIHVKEDDPTDPADVTKKVKIIFDENLALDDEEAENKQILALTLERLQMVARVLDDHIASVQRRIHVIKDMWKYEEDENDDN